MINVASSLLGAAAAAMSTQTALTNRTPSQPLARRDRDPQSGAKLMSLGKIFARMKKPLFVNNNIDARLKLAILLLNVPSSDERADVPSVQNCRCTTAARPGDETEMRDGRRDGGTGGDERG